MSNIDDDDEKNNLTNIIYDENLKEVLRIARNNVDPKDFKVDAYIKKIDGNDFYCISNKMNNAQKKLREIYKQYKNKLNFIEADKKNFTKPNYYAFCSAFISNFENCNCWEEITIDKKNDLVLLEFGYIEKNKTDKTQVFITETNRIPIKSSLKCKCCCSHNIEKVYFLRSKSGYSMMTGCCCIKKFFIKNPKIMNELKTIEDKQKEEKKKKEEKDKKEKKKKKEKEEKEKKDIEEKEKKEIKNRLNALNSKVYFPKYRESGLSYLEVSKNDTKYLKYLIETNSIKINDKYPNNAYIIEWIKNLNI